MIDYLKIAQAITFYSEKGFTPLEVPWITSKDIIDITLPEGCTNFSCELGHFVGSAEQSFLSLVKNHNLKGVFQASTPCFRDDKIDALHQKYFFKNELFDNINVSKDRLLEIIKFSESFFNKFIPVEVIQLSDLNYDIVSKKTQIELGSYGIRNHPDVGSWIYGTGCAEPRLSYVIEQEKNICLKLLKT